MSAQATPRSGPAALFHRLSGVYDTAVVQWFAYRPVQDQVMAELATLRPDRVADIGCGTGQLAARVASELKPAEVYGVDLAEGMLDQARARSGAVTWLHGPAEHLPLADASVDAVTSTEAFHWFQQDAALAEFRRVLAPGGHVVIGLLNPLTRLGSRLLDVQTVAAGGGHWPDFREMRSLVEGAGFRILRQTRVRRPIIGRLAPNYVTVAVRD
ncbi:MAG: class I SAM-dependent methyltransferase [Acidimicrobiales bacterium]